VIEYDVVKDLYKLEFPIDGKTDYISFEDVLMVLPKSWSGRKASAHQVRVVQSFIRAAHAIGFRGISRKLNTIAPVLNNFTEPGDYAMCCKLPHYEQRLESMIKEIKELQKMGCWKIVNLTSLLPGAKLINCRWVYNLKFQDSLSECHRARVLLRDINKKKGMIVSRFFCPPAHTLLFVLCLQSQPFLVRIRWIWMPCALSFQATLLLEIVSTRKHQLVTILVRVTACTCKCIHSLVQAPH